MFNKVTYLCMAVLVIIIAILLFMLLSPDSGETYGLYLELEQDASGLEFCIYYSGNAKNVSFKLSNKLQNSVLTEKRSDDGIWISMIHDFEAADEPVFLGYITLPKSSGNPGPLSVSDISAYQITVNKDGCNTALAIPAGITIVEINNS